MISFASFPSTSEAYGGYGSTRHHPDVEDDMHMDLDEDDFEENAQRLTVPGESITSSHAFMRYVAVPGTNLNYCSSHLEVMEHTSTTTKSLLRLPGQSNA